MFAKNLLCAGLFGGTPTSLMTVASRGPSTGGSCFIGSTVPESESATRKTETKHWGDNMRVMLMRHGNNGRRIAIGIIPAASVSSRSRLGNAVSLSTCFLLSLVPRSITDESWS